MRSTSATPLNAWLAMTVSGHERIAFGGQLGESEVLFLRGHQTRATSQLAFPT